MKNITKTILFASLIAALILPFSAMDFADAAPNENANDKAKQKAADKSKSDFDLMKEADNIMKKEKNLKYDKEGKNKHGAKNKDQTRHEEIIQELNSRGMFHISQERDTSMSGYDIVNTQNVNTDSTIEVTMYSPIASNIETNDSICSSCGQTHNKKISVRSGMEWQNQYFWWVIHREVGAWSPFTDQTEASTAQIFGNENDVTMYVQTKADHPITTASFSINSLLMVKTAAGSWVPLQSSFTKAYPSVYYATNNVEHGDDLYTEAWLPGPSRHLVTMTVFNTS